MRPLHLWLVLLSPFALSLAAADRAAGQSVSLDDHQHADLARSAPETDVLKGCCCRRRVCDRQTLLQWSYGTSFGGGPDLSEPLVTDRPDFTEASSTVGRGVVQLEAGYTYTFNDDPGEVLASHSYPETLLRVGILAQWLEFRIDWNYAEQRAGVGFGAVRARGSEDLTVGFKIGLTPQEGILPEMALIPQLSIATGEDGFTAGEELPGILWIYGWEVNDFIVTAGQTTLNRAVDEVTGEAFGEFSQSWTIGYSLTDRLGAYTEWFGIVPDGADTERTTHFFNGGFTFLVTNDLQLDIRGGVGLNEAADDYFLGTGFAKRF